MSIEDLHTNLVNTLLRVDLSNFRCIGMIRRFTRLEHWTSHAGAEDELNSAELVIVIRLFVDDLLKFDLSVAWKLRNII